MKYSLEERKRNELFIAIHKGLSEVLSLLQKEDFKNYRFQCKTNSNFLLDTHSRYKKLLNKCNLAGEEELTLIERITILAFTIKNEKLISIEKREKGKKLVKRIENLNEKFVTETILALLHYTSYQIKTNSNQTIKVDFSLEEYKNNNKKEYNELKNNIYQALITTEEIFSFEALKEAIIALYIKVMAYTTGLTTEEIISIQNRIKITDKVSEKPRFSYPKTEAFDDYNRRRKY